MKVILINTYRVLSIVSVCDENVRSYFSSVILDDTNYTMRGHGTESELSHALFPLKKKRKKDNNEEWRCRHDKKKTIGTGWVENLKRQGREMIRISKKKRNDDSIKPG